MPYIVRDLPTLTQTSSGAQFTNAISGFDDASALGISSPNTTSTGGISTYTFQVEPTSTGANFRNYTTSSYSLTTAAMYAVINNISFRQIRVQATAASSPGTLPSFTVVKQITV